MISNGTAKLISRVERKEKLEKNGQRSHSGTNMSLALDALLTRFNLSICKDYTCEALNQEYITSVADCIKLSTDQTGDVFIDI